MAITNSDKRINVTNITCGGTATVTLSLTAQPDIVNNPTDIVMLLDRSGSMAGSPLAALKSAAKQFIEIIDETTDGSDDGQIGGGSRIGIVSFSETATQDTGLITSVATLNAAVDALVADGTTNHADAFTKGLALFDPTSTNAKVMVMFTDGVTTAGGDPNAVATAAKALGVLIYVIGLDGNGGIDEQALADWASDPDSEFLAIAPNEAELEQIFENLARSISEPGAEDVVITDTVSSCFEIVSVSTPTKGTVELPDDVTLIWRIDELGVMQSESAQVEFTVRHVGPCTGTVEVNESIELNDSEGQQVDFPSPTLTVTCDDVVIIEPCPISVPLTVDGCEDTVELDAGDLQLSSLGRIVQIDVTLKNVCPGKRVALAVILSEIDSNNEEQKRGLKTLTVPAHTRSSCSDVTVRCIKFVLPEDAATTAICGTRNLFARFIAHYIDNDFECCQTV